MVEPTSPNIGLIEPNTGDLSGLWGSQALNPNFSTLDGYQAGVLSLGFAGGESTTLTVPSGFTATPGAGPVQSQNALIRITGALAANSTIVFPTPGYYIVENQCTNTATRAIILIGSAAGKQIGAPPNRKCHVFYDGTDMDYVNMPDVGSFYNLCRVTALPPWMTVCSVLPYLIRDGTQYLNTQYPALAAYLGVTFGGTAGLNFKVPDSRARIDVGLDPGGVAGRLTGYTLNSIAGVVGSTMGSAGGAEKNLLIRSNLQNAIINIPAGQGSHNHTYSRPNAGFVGSQNANLSAVTSISSGVATSTQTLPAMVTEDMNGGVAQLQQLILNPMIISHLPLIKT